ncbi:CubicO group peptidase (beta-lactamase class C family) [Sphingopyxis panaciterrae]|uniref:serine hydrolase domain-containing protein n=1 Tax=Sphingopyxis panaciterrae TaxID=363841 RepID=UPI00142182C7|nr:serine hydrolase domain-containing protein [Sphingopyxis panaciterrae]NIJ37761.1 CubicO group peptidase (beta-lactamase class C family) [Sphingopyxis panaciterrae]
MEAEAYIDGSGRLDAAGVPGPVPWWSFTKTILAIAALRLVEQGLLTLDDHVAGERFTLAQLLRHESGLPDYGGLPAYHADVAAGKPPWPAAQLLAAANAGQLLFRPGEGWAYSNIGYRRVGVLVAAAAQQPLAEALARLVFAPAGLATPRLALDSGDLAGVVMGDANTYHPGWVYHGLVTGTVADAARLVQALAMGRLLRPDMLARMREGRPLPEHRGDLHRDPAYGLGLMMPDHRTPVPPLGHEGSGPGSDIAVYARGAEACAVWTAASSRFAPAAQALERLGDGRP